ncbi:hypothetical protein D3C71_19230 [compost metagenome]
MATNIKFFVGSLIVRVGEYENTVRNLIVANSHERALEVLEFAAASYYGNGDEPKEHGGYYANGSQIHTMPVGVHEIGLAAFLELKDLLSVHRDANVAPQLDAEAFTPAGFKAFTKSVVNGCAAKGLAVGQSTMLAVLARAFGLKNWFSLNERLQQRAAPSVTATAAPAGHEGREVTGDARSFEVEVCRAGFGFATFRVTATSQEDAQAQAIEMAGDHEFSERSSEYEAVSTVAK